jgi:hypothetical protein
MPGIKLFLNYPIPQDEKLVLYQTAMGIFIFRPPLLMKILHVGLPQKNLCMVFPYAN